jgi:hypothetical protein
VIIEVVTVLAMAVPLKEVQLLSVIFTPIGKSGSRNDPFSVRVEVPEFPVTETVYGGGTTRLFVNQLP